MVSAKCCVYKHTSPSGKVYIGITKQKPEKRWGNGKNYAQNEYFFAAILKYGWGNFTHEIIADGLTREEAEKRGLGQGAGIHRRVLLILIQKFKETFPNGSVSFLVK